MIPTSPSISAVPTVTPIVMQTFDFYYPDFLQDANVCRNDGNEPYYMRRESLSQRTAKAPSGHWFVDWETKFCRRKFPTWSSPEEIELLSKDTEAPSYAGHAMFWEHEYSSAESCCSVMLGHQDTRLCLQDSIDSGQEHYTFLWYSNDRDQRCRRDCPSTSDPEQCGGHPYDITVKFFNDPETCCREKLSWIESDKCVRDALGSTIAGTSSISALNSANNGDITVSISILQWSFYECPPHTLYHR